MVDPDDVLRAARHKALLLEAETEVSKDDVVRVHELAGFEIAEVLTSWHQQSLDEYAGMAKDNPLGFADIGDWRRRCCAGLGVPAPVDNEESDHFGARMMRGILAYLKVV